MKRSVSGCCFKKNNDSIILINSAHSPGRQNFTLAHELYHILDNDEKVYICSDGLKNEIEENADEFASNFIITEHGLYDFIESNDIDKWNIDDVIKCEQYFQIDHNSLIRRLYSEKLIDGSQFADFSSNIISKARNLGYDMSLYESQNNNEYYSIGHMIPLTEKVCQKGKISQGRKKIFYLTFLDTILYTKEKILENKE